MERLQKVIAHAGVASRRKAEEMIAQGLVTVNGETVTEMGIQVGKHDRIEVSGVPIDKEEPVYYMLYKPKSVISAVSDPKGRPVVTDFFKEIPERIYPVGRLDYDTTGLLLLTNDGDFSQKLTHPSHEIDKVYVAKIKGVPTRESLAKLAKGVKIEGRKTAPAKVKMLSSDMTRDTAIIEVIIHEGRNHQVKKMVEAIGHQVMKLKRERLGSLTLHGLNPGEYRPLSKKEISTLLHEAKSK